MPRKPQKKIKLDGLDKKIIDLLTVDGRMSCADIALSIGEITDRMVRYRLERLVKFGVISFSAVVDPTKIGFPVIADVFIEVEPGQVNTLADHIASYDTVTYVACSTGERDISIQIVARDIRELYEFVSETVGKLSGVRRTTTSIVPSIVKDDAHWSIPASVVRVARLRTPARLKAG